MTFEEQGTSDSIADNHKGILPVIILVDEEWETETISGERLIAGKGQGTAKVTPTKWSLGAEHQHSHYTPRTSSKPTTSSMMVNDKTVPTSWPRKWTATGRWMVEAALVEFSARAWLLLNKLTERRGLTAAETAFPARKRDIAQWKGWNIEGDHWQGLCLRLYGEGTVEEKNGKLWSPAK